jgi:hypothetical protein
MVGLANITPEKKESMKVGMPKTWGGKRANSGRKKKNPSSYISFRVPIQEKEKIYLKYGKSIHELFKEWIKIILSD